MRRLDVNVSGDRCDPVSAPDTDAVASRSATGTLVVSRQDDVGPVARCPRPQQNSAGRPNFTEVLSSPLSLFGGRETVTVKRRVRARRVLVGPRRATFRVRLKAGRTRVRLSGIAPLRLTPGRYEMRVVMRDTSGRRDSDRVAFWLTRLR